MSTKRIDSLSLEQRMLRLERQNRRLKLAGIVGSGCLGLLLLSAQKPAPKTIEAGEFVVKDAAGHARIRIGVDPSNDAAELWLETANSERGASLSDSGLLLKQDGVARTIVESGHLALANSKGQQNVKLSAEDDAERALSIEGNSGNLFYLPGHALEVQDNEGYETAIGNTELDSAGGAATSHAASITLFDPDKKPIWKAP